MARIKGGMNAKKKHNRVLKLAKGYRGARSKQYRDSSDSYGLQESMLQLESMDFHTASLCMVLS